MLIPSRLHSCRVYMYNRAFGKKCHHTSIHACTNVLLWYLMSCWCRLYHHLLAWHACLFICSCFCIIICMEIFCKTKVEWTDFFSKEGENICLEIYSYDTWPKPQSIHMGVFELCCHIPILTFCIGQKGTGCFVYNQCSLKERNEVQHNLAPHHIWLSEVQFWLRSRDCGGAFVYPGEGGIPACDSIIGLDRHFEEDSLGWFREDAVPTLMCCTSFCSLGEHWLYA